jgi:cytochrome c
MQSGFRVMVARLRFRVLVGLGVAAALPAAAPARTADAAHGAQVFETCKACHNDLPDALGPNLIGVFGRKAGSQPDFHYSNAMKNAGFVWTAANLKDYLTDPQAKVKGNRMPFSGLANPADLDDLIAYLETLK